tara:strand:+ start:45 stop:500 length:456 start_codon:yes stop_codon:yes gene_type:complete
MDPVTIAAVAAGASGFIGYKGNMASAKAARQVGEYNAKVAEAEAVLLQRKKTQEEASLRKQSDRLISVQRVATAKSGIQMSGSPLQALADAYFNTELDAINIQQASKIEQFAKTAEAGLARAEGNARSRAYKTQAYTTLLSSGSKTASLLA